MGLAQFLFSMYFACLGAYLSVVLARVLHQNGKVLKNMDEGFRKMDERAEQRHKETVEQFVRMDLRAEQRHKETVEQFVRMDVRADQRHSEVIELLKRGFGDLTRDVRELKAA